VRSFVVCIALLTATAAAAQSLPTKLEIGTRQGSYYWVVETASDGSRRGGWVSVNVPLDAIDRSTLKPLPSVSALAGGQTPVQAPPASSSVDERLARIEQALSENQTVRQAPEALRSTPSPQVSQPRPDVATSAAHPQTREGFWFNGGLGVGLAGCVGCVGREVGTSGGLTLGGTLSDRVLLGVGTSGWYKSIDGVALTGGTFDARLRFYPAVRSGFFLTAGAGLGSVAVSDGFLSDRETGLGLSFGLGWDLRVGRNVSLTPFYNGFAMGVESGTFFVDQFGVGVTLH
jgi:hypothetical protein